MEVSKLEQLQNMTPNDAIEEQRIKKLVKAQNILINELKKSLKSDVRLYAIRAIIESKLQPKARLSATAPAKGFMYLILLACN